MREERQGWLCPWHRGRLRWGQECAAGAVALRVEIWLLKVLQDATGACC